MLAAHAYTHKLGRCEQVSGDLIHECSGLDIFVSIKPARWPAVQGYPYFINDINR